MAHTALQKTGLGIVIVLVLAALIVYFVPSWRASAEIAWASLTAPSDVRALQFLVGTDDNLALAHIGFGSLIEERFAGFTLHDAVLSGTHVYALLSSSSGTDVYDVSSGTPRAISNTGSPKSSFDVSPSGLFVAWTESAASTNVSDIHGHVVRILDTTHGTIVTLPTAARPHFVSEHEVLYLGSGGFFIHSATGESLVTNLSQVDLSSVANYEYDPASGFVSFTDPKLSQIDFVHLSRTTTSPVSFAFSPVASASLARFTQAVSVSSTLSALGIASDALGTELSVRRFDLATGKGQTFLTIPRDTAEIRKALLP